MIEIASIKNEALHSIAVEANVNGGTTLDVHEMAIFTSKAAELCDAGTVTEEDYKEALGLSVTKPAVAAEQTVHNSDIDGMTLDELHHRKSSIKSEMSHVKEELYNTELSVDKYNEIIHNKNQAGKPLAIMGAALTTIVGVCHAKLGHEEASVLKALNDPWNKKIYKLQLFRKYAGLLTAVAAPIIGYFVCKDKKETNPEKVKLMKEDYLKHYNELEQEYNQIQKRISNPSVGIL